MSHNVTVTDVELTDKQAIKGAVEELQRRGVKMQCVENTRYVGYNTAQSFDNCELVLKFDDSPYDVGLKYNEATSSYDIVYDPFMGHISRNIGTRKGAESLVENAPSQIQSDMGQFIQAYNACRVENQAIMSGKSVSKSYDAEKQMYNLVVNY